MSMSKGLWRRRRNLVAEDTAASLTVDDANSNDGCKQKMEYSLHGCANQAIEW